MNEHIVTWTNYPGSSQGHLRMTTSKAAAVQIRPCHSQRQADVYCAKSRQSGSTFVAGERRGSSALE